MSVYREQIAQLLRAVTIVSPTAHAWFGVPSSQLPSATAAAMPAEAARPYLVYALQAQLYADFYCAGGARPSFAEHRAPPPPRQTPFIQQLSRANSGTGSLDPDWTVVRVDNGRLVVARGGGLRFWATPAELRTSDGTVAAAGSTVSVVMPKELLRLSPGFYMGLGNAPLAFDGSMPLVRLYWNLLPSAAPALIERLTSDLNRKRIPFRVKVVSDVDAYGRCDAGVLYVPRATFAAVAPLAAAAYNQTATGLEQPVPALTKRLAPGLALAEDPPGGLASFGMSRCALLAEGIVRAAERDISDEDQRLAVIAEAFAEAGVDIEVPYLEQGSTDVYTVAGL